MPSDFDSLLREIPSEIRRRMRDAEIVISPALSDEWELDEYVVWQGARLIKEGPWKDCLRHVDWLVQDEC